jgi:hypothetical protein
MNKTIPCRLSVIMARKAHKAVILRRGPSRWYRMSLWDTDTDKIEHGQWLRGRVYEERCDLSPDGSLFIYFAGQQHHWRRRNEGSKSDSIPTYTAISKPPYFTALALWEGLGTWFGGGIFLTDKKVWLSHYCEPEPTLHPDFKLSKGLKVTPEWIEPSFERGVGDYTVHIKRMKKDGWKLSEQQETAHLETLRLKNLSMWEDVNRPLAWYKNSADAKFRLERTWYHDLTDRGSLYGIEARATGIQTPLNGFATWADWDHNERLVCTRDGQLWALDPSAPNEGGALIEDFNPQKFETILAPDWATKW